MNKNIISQKHYMLDKNKYLILSFDKDKGEVKIELENLSKYLAQLIAKKDPRLRVISKNKYKKAIKYLLQYADNPALQAEYTLIYLKKVLGISF
jgi:hypothetical protein